MPDFSKITTWQPVPDNLQGAGVPTPPAKPAAPAEPSGGGGISVDSLLKELNVPKQVFEPAGNPAQEPAPGASFFDPSAPAPGGAPIDPERAKRAGLRAAKMANGVLSVTAALIAKENDTDKYGAAPGEITDLGEAWADVSQEYEFTVNPWLSVILLTLSIYMPKFLQALEDRKVNILNRRIDGLEATVNQLQARQSDLKEIVK